MSTKLMLFWLVGISLIPLAALMAIFRKRAAARVLPISDHFAEYSLADRSNDGKDEVGTVRRMDIFDGGS